MGTGSLGCEGPSIFWTSASLIATGTSPVKGLGSRSFRCIHLMALTLLRRELLTKPSTNLPHLVFHEIPICFLGVFQRAPSNLLLADRTLDKLGAGAVPPGTYCQTPQCH